VSNRHKWTGPIDNRECAKCGSKRRGTPPNTEYQQWWGGWFPQYVPCAPIEQRRERWKRERAEADYAAAVDLVIKDRDELRDVIQRAIEASVGDGDVVERMLTILQREDGADAT
jgi:hypothetical protein